MKHSLQFLVIGLLFSLTANAGPGGHAGAAAAKADSASPRDLYKANENFFAASPYPSEKIQGDLIAQLPSYNAAVPADDEKRFDLFCINKKGDAKKTFISLRLDPKQPHFMDVFIKHVDANHIADAPIRTTMIRTTDPVFSVDQKTGKDRFEGFNKEIVGTDPQSGWAKRDLSIRLMPPKNGEPAQLALHISTRYAVRRWLNDDEYCRSFDGPITKPVPRVAGTPDVMPATAPRSIASQP